MEKDRLGFRVREGPVADDSGLPWIEGAGIGGSCAGRGRPDLFNRAGKGAWQRLSVDVLFVDVLFRHLGLEVVPRGVVRGEKLMGRRRSLSEGHRTVLGRWVDGEDRKEEECGCCHGGRYASTCPFARTVPREMAPGSAMGVGMPPPVPSHAPYRRGWLPDHFSRNLGTNPALGRWEWVGIGAGMGTEDVPVAARDCRTRLDFAAEITGVDPCRRTQPGRGVDRVRGTMKRSPWTGRTDRSRPR